MKFLIPLFVLGFVAHKIWKPADQNLTQVEEPVMIYMDQDCGGCKICQKEVNAVKGLTKNPEFTIIRMDEFPALAEKIFSETTIEKSPRNVRLPVMKVKGRWALSADEVRQVLSER
jgi:hypothetical protein